LRIGTIRDPPVDSLIKNTAIPPISGFQSHPKVLDRFESRLGSIDEGNRVTIRNFERPFWTVESSLLRWRLEGVEGKLNFKDQEWVAIEKLWGEFSNLSMEVLFISIMPSDVRIVVSSDSVLI
jgi:hypothetical protein